MKSAKTAPSCLIFGMCLIEACLLAIPVQKPDRTELDVVTSSDSIRELDPLLVKVALRNGAHDPILLKAFGEEHGSFRLEMRRVDSGFFAPIRTDNRTYKCYSYLTPTIISPGATMASYEWLFRNAGHSTPAPGSYELRASITIHGKTLSSRAVALRVKPIPPRERQLLETGVILAIGPLKREHDVLRLALGTPSRLLSADFLRTTGHDLAPRIRAIESQLTDSEVKRALCWKLAIDHIARAENAEERQKARDAFEELRKNMDSVTREVADLALITQYRELRDYEEAYKLLPRIVERSHKGDSLRHDVERGWKQTQ